MVVRRNDRRRRLKSDENTPSVACGDADTVAIPESAKSRNARNRRTYASGADRRNQLRTTDIFPKRPWLIAMLASTLFLAVVGINALAWFAESWRPVIGSSGVDALQLSGNGTLASWFICFTLFLAMAASLQIFALRRYRCDDYVGAYRMWIWVPPMLAFASMAAVVDFVPILWNVLRATTGLNVDPTSVLPIATCLVIVAVVAMRVLYEVRESKASFAMVALAWFAIVASLTMQSPALFSKTASMDLTLVVGNGYLVTAACLLTGLLCYTRFVYLHAHGLVVSGSVSANEKKAIKAERKAAAQLAAQEKAQQRAEALKKSRAEAQAKKQKDADDRAKKVKAKDVGKDSAKEKTAQPVAAGKKASKANAASVEKKVEPKSQAPLQKQAQKSKRKLKLSTKKPVVENAQKPEGAPAATMNSFQSLLAKRKRDQEAKSQQSDSADAPTQPVAESTQEPATIKMSKAERKRARKASRGRRAA